MNKLYDFIIKTAEYQKLTAQEKADLLTEVGENLFNEILITKEGIYQTRALNEEVMQKDLEVLKGYET